ncbi:hypothetical protein PUN4_780049 [Paraburkholderia unamae]|nr:hypothetical protein PUN4_780049 [Paraburkholderia unamae]
MNRIAAEQIIEMLKVNVLHLSDDEFEELHDEANAVVMTECNRLSEDWDAFQYLAAQKDRQAAERFHYFALALRAGAPIGQLMERVRDAIPMSFLVAEFRLSNVETGSGQTVG